jgi:hypothetical protein
MRNLFVVGILAAGIFLSSCSSGSDVTAPDAQSQKNGAITGATVQTISLDGRRIYNPCVGEWIVMEGSAKSVLNTVSDGSGGSHYNSKITYQGVKGIGQNTGDEYIVKSEIDRNLNRGDGGLPFESKFDQKIILNAKGKKTGSDYSLTVDITIIINANGETVVRHSERDVECD